MAMGFALTVEVAGNEIALEVSYKINGGSIEDIAATDELGLDVDLSKDFALDTVVNAAVERDYQHYRDYCSTGW